MSVNRRTLVSVVIPAYNRVTCVSRAVKSALGQTHQNLEIVVVDDGSSDGTVDAVKAIQDARLTLIRHQRNAGASASRNTGIRASTGEYVAFLDSDDEWHAEKVERQLELFLKAGASVGLVCTAVERVYGNRPNRISLPQAGPMLTRALLTRNVLGETSAGMVRRAVLECVGGFDEALPSAQDQDLWLRISEVTRVEIIREPMVRIDKSARRGGIGTNVSAVMAGRALFCHKHRSKMADQGVLYQYLRATAWLYLREARDPASARRACWASLCANAAAPATYPLFLACCIPLRCLDILARYKGPNPIVRTGSDVLPVARSGVRQSAITPPR